MEPSEAPDQSRARRSGPAYVSSGLTGTDPILWKKGLFEGSVKGIALHWRMAA